MRGKNPRKVLKGLFGARQYGESTADKARIEGVVHEIYATGGLKDPVRRQLLETRKALEAGWEKVAATLEDQGERTLAADVRGFAQQLPVVGTDRQKIALRFLQFKKQQSELQRHGMQPNSAPRARGREDDLTR